MPSVVSIPPNRNTATFEITSARVRPPASLAASATSDEDGLRSSSGLDARAQRFERLPARLGHRLAGSDAGDRCDDAVVPAEDSPRVGVLEAQSVRDDRDRERPGKAAPELCTTGGLDRVDEAVGLGLDERREPLAHGVESEGTRERVAVPAVLCAVPGQHALADDLTRGEAWIVHREGLRVAHDLQRQVATGHEPAVERGQPRDRLVLAQARKERMRVVPRAPRAWPQLRSGTLRFGRSLASFDPVTLGRHQPGDDRRTRRARCRRSLAARRTLCFYA